MKIITGLKTEDMIDAEALLSMILTEKTTAEAFSLDCTGEQACRMLGVAYKAEVLSRRHAFRMTKGLERVLSKVAEWMTSDHATFGLFLCGRSGNGKSTMLRAIGTVVGLYVPRTMFAAVNARRVARWAKAYVNTTDENWKDAKRYEDAGKIDMLAIDDVGTEPIDGMVYGEKVSAVADLIYERYDRQLTTFVSSNLSASEIAKAYDARVADRFREMMTIVEFGDEPSFRAGAGHGDRRP